MPEPNKTPKKKRVAQPPPAVRTKVSVSLCNLYVLGMDMKCPLCGTLVKSGQSHSCAK